MWSVLTGPKRVITVEPSTIGSRSRCTPSPETSGPVSDRLPATLSISSRKMTPDCSTRCVACSATWSKSISLLASSCVSRRRASFTETCRPRRGLLFGDHVLAQDVEDALFRLLRRLLTHLRHALVMHHADRRVHEIAHNRIDIAADIADLREFGGLNFDEGCVGELGQPARDFRFAYPSRPNHEDVLRRDLRLYLDGQREAAIAVTQRNSYRPLRLVLPNNIAVQLPNNMLGSQVSHRTRLLSEPTLQTSSVHGCRVDAGHSFG